MERLCLCLFSEHYFVLYQHKNVLETALVRNNTYWIHYMPNIPPSYLHILTHLIFTIALGEKFIYDFSVQIRKSRYRDLHNLFKFTLLVKIELEFESRYLFPENKYYFIFKCPSVRSISPYVFMPELKFLFFI